jgi:hypothetical protein
MVFNIHDAASGGNSLWSETQTVSVYKGIYYVVLGENTAVSVEVFDGSERYLGIKVGADSEMVPRLKLVSVGNAYKAYNSDNLGGVAAADYVLAAGDTMTDNLTVEGQISCEGFSMGFVDAGTSINRLRINNPDVHDDNAVINIGGEYYGSVEALGYPANTLSGQIFAQAKDDGTAVNYFGVAGLADYDRDNNEIYGLFGMAYGSGAFGFGAVGGTSTQNINSLGVVDGYADNGILVQHRTATGEGIHVTCHDTGTDTSIGIRIDQKGTGDMMEFRDNTTLISAVNDTGQLYFRNTNEDKIYFDGDGGTQKIELTASGLQVSTPLLTASGDVAADYIQTGGDELLAHDVIRHTVTTAEATAGNFTEAWSTATTAKIVSMGVVTLDDSDGSDTVSTDDWSANGFDDSVKYDGSNFTVYEQGNAWAYPDISTIYVVYEK